MAASSPVSWLPSLFLLLLPLLGIPEAEGQEVQQPNGPISVLSGDDVKLECKVSALFRVLPAGPVKWFMGKGPTRKLIYSDTSPSDTVTRTKPGSDTDFTISIHNVVPENAGTYYCVKQRKTVVGEEDLQSGHGTEVVVRSIPNVRIETNPTSPVYLNDFVTITCNVEGFYPKDISLIWLENGRETDLGKADPTTQNVDQTFTIKSVLEVVATKQRNLSVFTCQLLRDSHPLVNVDLMLKLRMQPGEDGSSHLSESGHGAFSNLGLGIGLFLGKIAAAFFLLYLFLRKDCSQVRLAT